MSAEKETHAPEPKRRRGFGQREMDALRQERILAAVLKCPTFTAAAAEAGVSERTVRRMVAKPSFQERLSARREQLFAATVGSLLGAAETAVDTLRRAMTCGRPSVEVRAAQTVLTAAMDGERFRLELGELATLRRRVAELTERAASPEGE